MPSLHLRARRRAHLLLSLVALGTASAHAQEPMPRTAAERTQWAAIVAAEDHRATGGTDMATLRAGLRSSSSAIRRVAVRAMGRLERESLIAELAPRLADPSASVRGAATEAVAQSAARAGAQAARDALMARVPIERDPVVRGMLGNALGRLAQGDSARVRLTSDALVTLSRVPNGSADAPASTLYGVGRGFYFLARQLPARNALPTATVARLRDLVSYGRDGARVDTMTAREVRELAGGALVAARMASEDVLTAMLVDPEPEVRRRALPAVVTLADTATARRLGLRAMFDPSPRVRALGVAAFAQRFGALKQCGPLLVAARDEDVGVRIAGIDALAAGCEIGSPAVPYLDSLASRLPAPTGADAGAWHVPAHALLTLAALAPSQTRSRGWLSTYAASPSLFVREYAARAATRARDTTTLRKLAADAAPNVRTTALTGLSELVGHTADATYVAALSADDNQLVMTAAKALEKSADSRAPGALLTALDRISATRLETQRDARVAILERLRELGDSSHAARVRPYLADFDTLVATRAADALEAWTRTRPAVAPKPLAPESTPTFADLEALAASRLQLEMADGGVIVVRFHAFDAPMIATRVARLARDGKLDGLTFHRVVASRLIQGGSPNANEYAGWGRFSRDELLRHNRRGTMGLSTRGRDTGDGQMYVNIADNFDFDHNYTVYGDVVSGMDVVDRMQEGAVIRRASVVGAPTRVQVTK